MSNWYEYGFPGLESILDETELDFLRFVKYLSDCVLELKHCEDLTGEQFMHVCAMIDFDMTRTIVEKLKPYAEKVEANYRSAIETFGSKPGDA